MTSTLNKQLLYDDIIRQIGDEGPFQKIFAVIFVFATTFLVGMQYMTKVVTLSVPDHWCHVPGRNNTNFTLEEWKNITIPRDQRNGMDSYSKCLRFVNNFQNETMTCDNGWEYNRTWYDMTVSMQNNWVCDDYMIPTQILAINRASEMIGAIIFGQLSDNIGRKPIFLLSMGMILVGRLATVFTSSSLWLFCITSFIGSFPCTPATHSPLIVTIEISALSYRAVVNSLLGIGWGSGLGIGPLIMWWQRDWVSFSLITTLPFAIYLLLQKWMIESPRWLASRGETERCMKELKTIAKMNKTKISQNIAEQLRIAPIADKEAQVYTILSLVSSLRLGKNVIILVYGISTASIVYLGLVLSINNLEGNPFLTYLFLGLVDIPVCTMNKFSCNRFGRRIVALFGLFISFVGNLSVALIGIDTSYTVLMTIAFICIKSAALSTFSSLSLQIVEICPTCVRQSGTSMALFITNCFCILGPYIIILGTSIDFRLPFFIYAGLLLLAFVSCIFLPETLGYQLPDTLDDAAKFGANQDFWGRIRKDIIIDSNGADEPLNS